MARPKVMEEAGDVPATSPDCWEGLEAAEGDRDETNQATNQPTKLN